MAQTTNHESAQRNDGSWQNASQGQTSMPAAEARDGGDEAHASRDRGVAQDLMEMFIGTWKIEGRNAPAAPDAPGVAVTGIDRYEWMPGGFFVVSRFSHHFGEGVHEGVSVIGYDPDEHSYFADNFDNLGFHRRYRLVVREEVWTFTGEFERATLVFDEDRSSFTATWEISTDGRNWAPLCALNGTKAK